MKSNCIKSHSAQIHITSKTLLYRLYLCNTYINEYDMFSEEERDRDSIE